MDPITHFSAGVIIGTQISSGPLLPVFCGFLSIVNDFDFVFKWMNHKKLYFLHHKAFHSIFTAIIMSAISAVPLSLIFKINFGTSFLLCLLIFITHLGLDLLVAGGDMTLLFPFSMKLYSLPLFPGLTPRIKTALCADKSPITCGICQTEVFLRSLFRLSLVGIAVALMLERNLIGLVSIPLSIILIKGLIFLLIYKYLKKQTSNTVHLIPLSFFPCTWNALSCKGENIHVKNIRAGISGIRETTTAVLRQNDILSRYKDILSTDKNISSFMESHPVLYAEKASDGCDDIISIYDPRFKYNDGNVYFLYRIRLEKGISIAESEFREKWSR